jgi:hypothetical protein
MIGATIPPRAATTQPGGALLVGTTEPNFAVGLGKRLYPCGMASVGAGMNIKALTVGRLYGVPFFVAQRVRLARVAVYVTAGGAVGSVLRFGIYGASGINNEPSALLYQAPVVSTVAIGIKEDAAADVILQPGLLYWAAFLAGVSGPTITAFAGSSSLAGPLVLGFDPADLGGAIKTQLISDIGYQALPNPWPAGATPDNTNNTIPALFIGA